MLAVAAFLSLATLISASPMGSVSHTFRAQSADDYGSGATVRTDWYSPGGISGIGAFAGHPNSLNRGDRVLVRFNVSPLFVLPASETTGISANLRFCIAQVAGKTDVRKIEVSHLRYDPWSLGGNDLVNADADVVGVFEVRRADCSGRVFTVDVSASVRANLTRGDKYCAFRIRDVGAEAHGNVDLVPTGVTVAFEQDGPVLEVTTKADRR